MNALEVTEHFTSYGLPYVELRGCEDFDPVHIFECGQCFRWNPLPGNPRIYLGAAGGRVLAVRAEDGSEGKIITLANAGLRDYYAFWENYFDMKRDYAAIRRTLSERDAYLKEAAALGSGLRILRQEPFETLISFILSSNNNIPRIKGCVERLAERYGAPIETEAALNRYLRENSSVSEWIPFYAFPSPERLAGVSAEAFSACCRAGYRCAYLEKTVRRYLDTPIDPEAVRTAPLPAARGLLQMYSGVGPKVADCVMLFAGMRTDVFPVDVWVRRVLEELYFRRRLLPGEAEAFVSARFGTLAGFAQQYLFYGIREYGVDFLLQRNAGVC